MIPGRKLTAMRKVVQTCRTSPLNVYFYLIFSEEPVNVQYDCMCLIEKVLWEDEGGTSKSRKLDLIE